MSKEDFESKIENLSHLRVGQQILQDYAFSILIYCQECSRHPEKRDNEREKVFKQIDSHITEFESTENKYSNGLRDLCQDCYNAGADSPKIYEVIKRTRENLR